ncbi:MAG TPA: NAD(P)/FAD-dependent oxidoreductase [Myxococcaceae bacterium]|nr:NAD(P)/FAD-dependent oxidoreductase [Myxococcaceae bacterium]
MTKRPKVIIVGAGFGGLYAAKALRDAPAEVLMIDKNNYHTFQPLLYQVATAGLNPSDIAVPIRSEFRGVDNVIVRLRRAESIDLENQTIDIHGVGPVHYDALILASGSQHSYFGKDEWEPLAPGLKTLSQATEIRRRILVAFEHAENERDPEIQRALLNFVVVGGGPTGVELAGAIADISRTVLVRDFRRINPSTAKITLVEGGPRLLAAFDPSLSERAQRDLESLGVEVQTGALVTDVTEQGVWIGETFLPARTVIWAAGVEANRLTRTLKGVRLDRAGRVFVEPDLSLPGAPHTFAIGDLAHAEVDGKITPGLAPAAQQMGRLAAANVLRMLRGEPTKAFRYVDKGSMATIGKHKAIMELGRFRKGGYFAWLGWLLVHVFTLIGFRNRFAVLLQWTWNYLFSRRGARLITERGYRTAQSANRPEPGKASETTDENAERSVSESFLKDHQREVPVEATRH